MRRVLLTSLVLVAIAAVPAFGQGDRSQIAGFVKDQSGAVIPGATVTIVNSQTRLEWTSVTDGRGYYVFPALAPGMYEIAVELQGFKKWMQTGMTLDAASSARVDVSLETGVLAETITVMAVA
ncbi:MAG: carboxypeptidase-like regulatory domain-containing protein, partial [Vicinamibacterales bacterium]